MSQIPIGSAKRERHIGWCAAAPSYQPCQEQPGSSGKKEPSDHLRPFSARDASPGTPLVIENSTTTVFDLTCHDGHLANWKTYPTVGRCRSLAPEGKASACSRSAARSRA